MVDPSQRVLESILSNDIPWRLPAFPRNIRTGKPYGGVVPLLLNIASDAMGCCECPAWGSHSDWTTLKSRVPFGIGVLVPGFTDPLHNWVFTDRAYHPPPLPLEDPDKVFDAIVKGLGVKMEFGFDATCKYIGSEDKIRIPHRFMFEIGAGGISGWFDALGHELIHASEPRLRWDGHPDVAELRAEIGSGYLCGLLGVKPLPRRLACHHDAHVGRWVRLMRADPQLILKVCVDVARAVSYLLRFAPGKEVTWHDAALESPCRK